MLVLYIVWTNPDQKNNVWRYSLLVRDSSINPFSVQAKNAFRTLFNARGFTCVRRYNRHWSHVKKIQHLVLLDQYISVYDEHLFSEQKNSVLLHQKQRFFHKSIVLNRNNTGSSNECT